MAAYSVTPIGHLETPWATPADCPRNGRQPDPLPECRAVVSPEFQDGLLGLDGFSHLILLYHLHQASGARLTVTPFLDDRPHGIFATRSPARPNPLGLSTVRLLGVEGTTLRIADLDIVDGTPLLDIKPYVPAIDDRADVRIGWFEGKVERARTIIADGRFRNAP